MTVKGNNCFLVVLCSCYYRTEAKDNRDTPFVSPQAKWCLPLHCHVTRSNLRWLIMFTSLFPDETNYFRCFKQSSTLPLQILA